MDQLSVTGGARVGWVNASWPLAQLSVSDGRLRLDVRLIGRYEFVPEDVIAFEKRGMIPVLTSGVAIVHRRADYPQQILFWSVRPDALIERIRAAGFVPRGQAEPAGPVQTARGFPMRWQVLVLVAVAWNALLLPYMLAMSRAPEPPRPGIGMVMAPAMLFAFALATKSSPAIQRLVMREGRSVGEILPALNLVILVAGLLTVVFSLVLLAVPR